MYRKVVFSKEPTVLKLESGNPNDDAAFIHLKHRSRAFYIGGRRDQFGIYPGDLAVSTLSQAYFTVAPVAGSEDYQLACDRLKTKRVSCSNIYFDNGAQITAPSGSLGHLRFNVPSNEDVFQFGTAATPWVTLRSNVFHFNGDICCQRLYASSAQSVSMSPSFPASALPLDASGKIPMEYLPEVYQTSLIHNNNGVGIGTDAPLQKFHLEGSGFIRGRLAVGGDASASASLHLKPPSATPGLRIDVSPDAPALEIYGASAESPVVQMGLTGIQMQPPIRATSLTIDELIIPHQLYYRHNRLNINAPMHIEAPLTVRSIVSEDARPLVLETPSVHCSNIHSPEWTYPLDTVEPSSDSPQPSIPMTFQATQVSLTERTLAFNDRAWKEAYQNGDELARLTMTDDSHIEMTRVIAFLWGTVQELRQRVNELENKQN